MRTPMIAGNWKLHKTLDEAVNLVGALKTKVKDVDNVEILVAPPFTAISMLATKLAGSNIKIGAQNCYFEPSGAFTGELSAPLLKDAGCDYVIVGHSERRQIFGESIEMINNKVKAVLEAGLSVILCIGETLEERESGEMYDILTAQVKEGLAGVTDMERVVIAYEPVWAIGTGKTASSEQAQEVHSFVRGLVQGLYTPEIAAATRILYGGSVKPGNVDELMAQSDVDGALVGGASLVAEDFARIVKFE
ncbi:MAG: triose-phosphate isomerase [Desulfuromonas sp.]|nr:MAG: triose-phosphate isomerase [Desulfuromonas sp.]